MMLLLRTIPSIAMAFVAGIYSTLLVHLSEQIYRGPEISLGEIELGPRNSPVSEKPGALVELRTYGCQQSPSIE